MTRTIRTGLAVVLAGALMLSACGDSDGGDTASAGDCEAGTSTTTDEGLVIEEVECGEGDEAVAGVKAFMHYTGKLEDGTEFDSSIGGPPFPFRVGAGDVIRGWDLGVPGMRVGGKRRLTIPPELAYGDAGAGDAIPPGATLIFDVELVEVQE
jgi:FKBP-type peptidyl-prolyl cis-trans isomerase FkpA